MQAVLGIVVLVAAAWLLSEARDAVRWRPVALGLALQLAVAALLLRVPWLSEQLLVVNELLYAVEAATMEGTRFLFGYLGGGPVPFEVTRENAVYLFAFRVLPQIIVFSVLVALLWYWRVLPLIVRGFGFVLRKALDVGGAVGTGAAAALFLGMAETPMVVRGYLTRFSRSELFTVMTAGMSTVSGSIMVLYANVLRGTLDGALLHILTASVINVIGAVYLSRLMIPPQEAPTGDAEHEDLHYAGVMDAITRGTSDGVNLAVNVAGMLIVLISLVALVNLLVGNVEVGGAALSLERLMGWLFSPVAWLMGIPWSEAQAAGGLLGTKLILNELVAYVEFAELPEGMLSPASALIMTYGLCGFANFGSMGILLAGLSTLAPQRRREFLDLGPKSLVSGTLVCCVTGALVALVSLF